MNNFVFFLASLIPNILLILFIRDQKSKKVLIFYAWGICAFFICAMLNGFIGDLLCLNTETMSVSTAPLVEELFKALPLLLLFIIGKERESSFLYIAMASGIGFSIQENYSYIMTVMNNNDHIVLYIIIRSLSVCVMHGLSTAVVGYGLQTVRKDMRNIWTTLFGFFTIAVTFHALFNLYIASTYMVIGAVIPLVLYLCAIIFLHGSTKAVLKRIFRKTMLYGKKGKL